jgi:ABC-2 type transport system ATP-binding protein
LIKELGREKTVVLSTHILSEVQATCDRIVIINAGKIVADNTPEGLQAGLEGRTVLIVAMKSGPSDAVAKVRSLSCVENVRQMPGTNGEIRLRIDSTAGQDVREAFFNLAVHEKWVLLEMIPETQSLEEVFHKLTAA